jgi:DNA modification methylase
MLETNRIINGDCVVEMGKLPESIIDLIVTSPPYNVGIDYDTHDDNQSMEEYWKFTEKWVAQAFRVLKR